MATSAALKHKITTFAVLDLETSNLPAYNFNKVGVTELSIYAFSVDVLAKKQQTSQKDVNLPARPRVLHKLTLLFNPQMMVTQIAESLTKLDNYILEFESPFNENAATTLLGFLNHLQQPICLVAHNGWNFDFRILKKLLKKFNMKLPEETVCIDTFRAFYEIDRACMEHETEMVVKDAEEKLQELDQYEIEFLKSENRNSTEILFEHSTSDWCKLNETTPINQRIDASTKAIKRKQLSERSEQLERTPEKKFTSMSDRQINARRTLFNDATNLKFQCDKKLWPPKGKYKLNAIYERVFKQSIVGAHCAEVDVNATMNLMQYYGNMFVQYAETFSIPFSEVQSIDE